MICHNIYPVCYVLALHAIRPTLLYFSMNNELRGENNKAITAITRRSNKVHNTLNRHETLNVQLTNHNTLLVQCSVHRNITCILLKCTYTRRHYELLLPPLLYNL